VLARHIAALNARLSPLDLEVRSTRSQHDADRTQLWVLINTTSDDLTQLATPHSPAELAFVRRVLDAMFETHNTPRAEVMALKGTQALNLHKAPRNSSSSGGQGTDQAAATAPVQGSSAQGITMKEAERVMKEMTEEGWFEYSKGGFYSLSPRALLELRGWLVEMYNEADNEDGEGVRRIKFCEACREIVTVVREEHPFHSVVFFYE
jgi:non-structural maintenance of chromosomes element 1